MTNDQKKSLLAAVAALSQNYVYPADARLAKECVQNVLTAHLDAFEEVYYELESQNAGDSAGDWVNSGWGQWDTLEAAQTAKTSVENRPDAAFDYRIVRVTITREVL